MNDERKQIGDILEGDSSIELFDDLRLDQIGNSDNSIRTASHKPSAIRQKLDRVDRGRVQFLLHAKEIQW